MHCQFTTPSAVPLTCPTCQQRFWVFPCRIRQGQRFCSLRCKPKPKGRIYPSPLQRFWAKVDKNGPLPERRPELEQCWPRSGKTDNGYTSVSINRSNVKAHRFSYELEYGPIPNGLTIDHLCRLRRCVRPSHLEAVTSAVNTLRGDTLPAKWIARSSCQKGHEYSPDNTYLRPDGSRICRSCDLIRTHVRRSKARSNQSDTVGTQRVVPSLGSPSLMQHPQLEQ